LITLLYAVQADGLSASVPSCVKMDVCYMCRDQIMVMEGNSKQEIIGKFDL